MKRVLITALFAFAAASTILAAERSLVDIENDLKALANSNDIDRQKLVASIREVLQRQPPVQHGVFFPMVNGKIENPPDLEAQEKQSRQEHEEYLYFCRVKDLCLALVAKHDVTEVVN